MRKVTDIKEMQRIELDMLEYINEICSRYGLTYFLAGGTLLGAVRHHGFIPWDDDVDIAMPRSDYEKLIKLSKNWKQSRYQLLAWESCKDYFWIHAKLIDTQTECVESTRKYLKSYGLFIDIFPLDGLGNTLQDARKTTNRVIFLRRRLRAFELMLDGQRLEGLKRLFLQLPFCIIGKEKTYSIYKRILMKNDFTNSKYVGSVAAGIKGEKEIFEREVYSKGIKMQFEGKEFNGMYYYDTYLKRMYGDYMELPPESDRKGGHPIEVYWKE